MSLASIPASHSSPPAAGGLSRVPNGLRLLSPLSIRDVAPYSYRRRETKRFQEDVEIRIAAMRVFEDLDRRLRALEESHDGDS